MLSAYNSIYMNVLAAAVLYNGVVCHLSSCCMENIASTQRVVSRLVYSTQLCLVLYLSLAYTLLRAIVFI